MKECRFHARMVQCNELKEMKNANEMKNGAGVDVACYMKPNWSFMYLVTIIFFSIITLKYM